ncbi:YtxH domain-containing protein [Bacillus sp. V3-13]|uniref:YtxH domain-containing protein n=1 Tax=Bacillus sp. V3-13 TaxID=2053728 RepID=UPI0015E0B6BD|nr:YtxH domain-containing protein [Bacillus sp. V3-13]
MTDSNRFWKGMLYGALAGGVISLFNRQTRNAFMSDCRSAFGGVANMVKHPGAAAGQIKEVTSKLRSTVEEISNDVAFISQKVEEMREITPQVAGIVKETKEAFTGNDKNLQDGAAATSAVVAKEKSLTRQVPIH